MKKLRDSEIEIYSRPLVLRATVGEVYLPGALIHVHSISEVEWHAVGAVGDPPRHPSLRPHRQQPQVGVRHVQNPRRPVELQAQRPTALALLHHSAAVACSVPDEELKAIS